MYASGIERDVSSDMSPAFSTFAPEWRRKSFLSGATNWSKPIEKRQCSFVVDVVTPVSASGMPQFSYELPIASHFTQQSAKKQL